MDDTSQQELAPISREERIRTAAYQIWEEAGCPHGCADEHWLMATEQVDRQDQLQATIDDPDWLKRNQQAAENLEPAVEEKSQLSKSIDEIKKRIANRAA